MSFDHDAIREMALQANLWAHGVSVTVTRPMEPPVETQGIWLNPLEGANDQDLQRREPRRVLMLPRSAVSTLPRGTLLTAAETSSGPARTWRVDELVKADPYCWHVAVVINPERP